MNTYADPAQPLIKSQRRCAQKWFAAVALLSLCILSAGCVERPMGPPLEYDSEDVEQIRKDVSDFEF